jgi:hypothetical protein
MFAEAAPNQIVVKTPVGQRKFVYSELTDATVTDSGALRLKSGRKQIIFAPGNWNEVHLDAGAE